MGSKNGVRVEFLVPIQRSASLPPGRRRRNADQREKSTLTPVSGKCFGRDLGPPIAACHGDDVRASIRQKQGRQTRIDLGGSRRSDRRRGQV